MKITTAVIPVAGKGTRFLPASKSIPKEMFPIISKPMIHYIIEEAVDAGIKQIVLVVSSGKEAIKDYFDRSLSLETFLKENGKEELAEDVKQVAELADIITVSQKEQLGLGHAISCTKEVIGNEDFAILLGDDLTFNTKSVTRQLIEVYEKKNANVVGVMEVENKHTSKYGIVDGEDYKSNVPTFKINNMIEKPKPEEAPTNFAVPGRYVLKNEIFAALSDIKKGAGGEYQLTDAIKILAKQSEVYAHVFTGDRYDTGTFPGYLDAILELSLQSYEYSNLAKNLIKAKMVKYKI